MSITSGSPRPRRQRLLLVVVAAVAATGIVGGAAMASAAATADESAIVCYPEWGFEDYIRCQIEGPMYA
jgi:hypothetical protein